MSVADTTERVVIARDRGRDLDPNWFPDGGLLFASDRHGGDLDVFVVPEAASDATAQRLTRSNLDDWSPAAAPDGIAIVYVSGRAIEEDRGNGDLFLQGRSDPRPIPLTVGERDARDPVWAALLG
jgi:Tol biopolymer transport system component